MSKTLDAIKESALKAIEAMGGFPEALNETHDYVALITEKSGTFKDSFGVAFDDIVQNNDKMLESMGYTKESIAEMTEVMHEKIKAIEATGEAIEGVGNKASASSRGINQMAGSAARLLGSLGVIPKSVASGTMAVTQLNRSMQSTIPTAAKLTAMLGPITLIATAVMAIVNTVKMLALESDKTALPSFDALIGRAERLHDKSEDLSYGLQENIDLMIELGRLGASDELIRRFERENEILRQNSELHRHMARTMEDVAAAAAMESITGRGDLNTTNALLAGGGAALTASLTGGLAIIPMIGAALYDTVFGEQYLLNFILDPSDYDIAREKMERMASGEELSAGENEALMGILGGFSEYADMLRDRLDPAHQAMAAQLDALISDYNKLGRAAESAYNEMHSEAIAAINAIERERQRLIDLIEREARAEEHRAAVTEDVHRHILSSYRDTYAAAESLRSAHDALSHALAGTSGEYMSQLDIFNKVMNLSPHYLSFLMDEYGVLVDVEDAVYRVTQAQIELMGARQANAVLEAAEQWMAEGNALSGYRAHVIDATQGIWGMVEARMANLRIMEQERLVSEGEGMAFSAARYMADVNLRESGVFGQIDAIRTMTENAQAGARERGVFRSDGAMLVADVTAHDIMGEFVRIRADVAKRDYMEGAFQSGRGSVVINMGGFSYSPNVYPTELSREYRADIVREGADEGARICAEQLGEMLAGFMG